MRSEDATHVYIGRKKCGCLVAAATDLQDKWTAKSVSEFIKSGLTVDRIPFEEYRKLTSFGCKCDKQGDTAVREIENRILQISELLKGPLPNIERRLLHEDRKDLREMLDQRIGKAVKP